MISSLHSVPAPGGVVLGGRTSRARLGSQLAATAPSRRAARIGISASMGGSAVPTEPTAPTYRKNLVDFELLDRIIPGRAKRDNGLVPCPSTIWNVDGIDITSRPAAVDTEFPLVMQRGPELITQADEVAYLEENRDAIRAQVEKHGAVLLRGFGATRKVDGFRSAYQALGFLACEDPLSKTGLRKSVTTDVYETVNNLPKHFVGMHNESSTLLAPRHAAFVCFQPADKGGEFLLLDGRRMYAEMDEGVLGRMLARNIRFKVAGFDFSFLPDNEFLRAPLMAVFEKLFLGMTKAKFDLTYYWNEKKGGKRLLEAVEPPQPPVTRHPDTGEPMWFCNVHNHSRYLREHRECDVPEVAMTETYYGDLTTIPLGDIDHINEVTQRNTVEIRMEPGDVVLLDNYAVLHGRNTFTNEENTRLHSVAWFSN